MSRAPANGFGRRDWLRLALAASLGGLAGAARARVRFEADPFQLGVASGMPTPGGVALWTRLMPANPYRNPWARDTLDVRWELAEDEAFRRVVRRGVAQAVPLLAHSVHVEVDGLEAGRWYHYRFAVGDAVSPAGRTRTAPAGDAPVERLRLAFASCQRLSSGRFGAYRRLLEEDVDAVAFLGDYVYATGALPSPTVPERLPPARTLDDYRAYYELHKRSPELQACHAALPWLAMWDDHEVANDYAGAPLRGLAPGRLAAQRRAAYQAWYEHMPLRHAQLVRGVEGLARSGEELRLYADLAWGRLAALHLLDCRQYRDPQACRGIAGMVDPGDCPGLGDPRRGMLGAAQEAWLVERLREQSTGRGRPWTLLLQATMVSPRRIPFAGAHRVWNDGWDGYPAARARLLDAIDGLGVAGPVFVGGDLHENWACNVPADPGAGERNRRWVATEFVGTGISRSSLAPGAIDAIRAANPHAVYADAGRCGYGVIDLAPGRIEVSFRVTEDVWNPDPAIATAARFAVEAGNPRVLPC